MSILTVLTLAVLLGVYGLTIAGLAWVLSRVRLFKSCPIFSSFVVFGLATGLLAVRLWPMDSSVYPNLAAALLGDWAYLHAVELFGDPYSAQAGYTVPWLLRVPQVHAVASFMLCGVLGAAVQWLYDRRPGCRTGPRASRPVAARP